MNYLQEQFVFHHSELQLLLWFLFFGFQFVVLFFFKNTYQIEGADIIRQFFHIRKIARNFPQKSAFYWVNYFFFLVQISFSSYFLLLYLFFRVNLAWYYYFLENFIEVWFSLMGLYLIFVLLRVFLFYLSLRIFNQQILLTKMLKIEWVDSGNLSFLLVFLNAIFYFSASAYKWNLFLITILGLLFWMVLLHWIRLFKFSKLYHVSSLYIICYICTLEILPLTLTLKFFFLINALDLFKI